MALVPWSRIERALDRWVLDVPVVAACVRHVGTSSAVAIAFQLGYLAVEAFLRPPMREIVEYIDGTVVVIVLLIAAFRTIQTVARGRKGDTSGVLAFAL